MKITLMTDRYGYQEAIKEQRNEWLENLLLFLGIDIQVLKDQGQSLFIQYLFQNKIEILENVTDGSLNVKLDNDLVGSWSSPVLILKRDDKGGLYYEIALESWSILEEGFIN